MEVFEISKLIPKPRSEFLNELTMKPLPPTVERGYEDILLEGEWDVVKALHLIAGQDWRNAHQRFDESLSDSTKGLSLDEILPENVRRFQDELARSPGGIGSEMQAILGETLGLGKNLLGSAAAAAREDFEKRRGGVTGLAEDVIAQLRSKGSYSRHFDYDSWGTSLFKTTLDVEVLEKPRQIGDRKFLYSFYAHCSESHTPAMRRLISSFPLPPALNFIRMELPIQNIAFRGLLEGRNSEIQMALIDWPVILDALNSTMEIAGDAKEMALGDIINQVNNKTGPIYHFYPGVRLGRTEFGSDVYIYLRGITPLPQKEGWWNEMFWSQGKQLAPAEVVQGWGSQRSYYRTPDLNIVLKQNNDNRYDPTTQRFAETTIDNLTSRFAV